MPEVAELLAAYDAQLRTHVTDRLPRGVRVERDGPLLRFLRMGNRGFVVYRDLGELENADLDELIARQVRVFADRGEHFEWKLHGHDRPTDLPQRLRAARFVPEEEETVMIAPVTEIAGQPQLPEGVSLRDATDRRDLDRIAALELTITGDDHGWLAESLESERDANPDALARSSAERTSRRCGAAPRCRRGVGGGSTEQPSLTGRTWPPSAVSGLSRSMLPATAGRSSSVSDSPQ